MNIFLSYASQDRALVEPVRLALAAQGHDIFFDREDLPPGEEYDGRIRTAIENSELFIAFLSPDTFDVGSYTITEIEIAERVWPHPQGRILPVMLRRVDFAQIPAYLKSVTLLDPTGNVAASVADVVHQRARRQRTKRLSIAAIVVLLVLTPALAYVWYSRDAADVTRDGAPLTLVPAGEFEMGDGIVGPLRHVYLSEFYIDRFEVTTARYAKFLAASDAVGPPEVWASVQLDRDGELPVVGVSWADADAYCRWAERRLPTEAEWEKAARGADGRTYPWGDDEPTQERANFLNSAAEAYPEGLHAVGKHPLGKSAHDAFDQAGNAAEWTADWFAETFDRQNDSRNPRGPDTGTGKVIRGGGWREPAARMNVSLRMQASADTRNDDLGFRCARDAKAGVDR